MSAPRDFERLVEAAADARATQRFWSKVTTGPGCWGWGARINAGGYSMFSYQRRQLAAHRLSYMLHNGPIPEGLFLDHLCRNRACVNPAHLEPVTNRENILRGETVTGDNYRKTHCSNGHEYTPENTYRSQGHRACRLCKLGLRNADRNVRTGAPNERDRNSAERRLELGLVDSPNGCREWTRHRNEKGQGRIKFVGRMTYVHRVVWELANGPIPDGMVVAHRCGNQSCGNLDHLYLRPVGGGHE